MWYVKTMPAGTTSTCVHTNLQMLFSNVFINKAIYYVLHSSRGKGSLSLSIHNWTKPNKGPKMWNILQNKACLTLFFKLFFNIVKTPFWAPQNSWPATLALTKNKLLHLRRAKVCGRTQWAEMATVSVRLHADTHRVCASMPWWNSNLFKNYLGKQTQLSFQINVCLKWNVEQIFWICLYREKEWNTFCKWTLSWRGNSLWGWRRSKVVHCLFVRAEYQQPHYSGNRTLPQQGAPGEH